MKDRTKFQHCFWIHLILLALFCLAAAAAPPAPDSHYELKGIIKDPSAAVIPNAKVTLQARSGDQKLEAASNQEGSFAFSQLLAGDYRLVIQADGFKTYQTSLHLDAGIEQLEVMMDFAVLQSSVLVTATRTEAAAADVGSSVTLIPSQQIEQSRATSMTELLRDVPGFTILQTGGRGGQTSLFARGGESDYNKVLIDGFPVNDIGGGYNFGPLTASHVERIEAMRGPGSALYGADAIASVVQVVSPRGTTATPQLDLLAEGGSFGFFRQSATFSGILGRADYSASVENFNSNGRYINDDDRSTLGSGNFGWQFSNSLSLRTTLRYSDMDHGDSGPVRAWGDLGYGPDPDHRDGQKDLLLGVTLEQRLRENWNQRISYYHVESSQFSRDPVAQNPQDYALDYYNHPRRRGIQYQTNAQLPWRNAVSAGFDFDVEDATIDTLKVNRHNYGLYFQDQLALGSRLHLVVGGRVDDDQAKVPAEIRSSRQAQGLPDVESNGYGLTVTPRATATFWLARPSSDHFLQGTRLRFSYGLGIKSPTLLQSFSPYPEYQGNPALRPERTRSFDAGVDQYFRRGLQKLEITYFDNRFRDLVDYIMTSYDPLTWTMTGTYINSEREFARGFETQLSSQPIGPFTFSVGYNFTETRFQQSLTRPYDPVVTGGLTLLRRPKHSGSARLTYSRSRLNLFLSETYVGERNDVNPVYVYGEPTILRNDGFNKVDLGVNWRLNKHVTFITRIDNLLNQEYEEILGYPAYRLNFSSGLKIQLGGK